MKNNLKKIMTFVLIGVSACMATSCASNELPAQNNPSVVGGYTSEITFNYIRDADISYLNPKIRTIKEVAMQNPSAVAVIKFNSIYAKPFAMKVKDILNKEGVSTDVIGYANKEKEAVVSVYIKFRPLDEVLKQQNQEKIQAESEFLIKNTDNANGTTVFPANDYGSMTNITGNING